VDAPAPSPARPVPRLGRGGCLGIFAAALAVRAAASAAVGFSTLSFGDASAYVFAARHLARTGHYPLRTDSYIFRPPGYPAFLVAATLGDPDRLALAKIANALLGALACVLLAALSARLFRDRRLAIATGILAALCPGLVILGADVQSEPLFLVLQIAAGFLLLAAVDRPSSNLALAAGAAVGLAVLTRPAEMAVVPLLAAPLADGRYPLRARWHLAASALLGAAAVVAPWTLRNALVFHELIPVHDGAGIVFYQGNSDWTIRFYRDVRTRAEFDRWISGMDGEIRRVVEELDRTGRTSPTTRSRHFFRLALAERARDPAGWVRLELRKAWDWLRPYPSPIFWPMPVVAAAGAFYTALMALAAWGLRREPRAGVRLFVLAFLALTMLSYLGTLVLWRYRLGCWDPVLVLYGAWGAASLMSARAAARLPR
jgi:4-amino-4-deoxy-L-arabinose transferase-like glycosyltransferase